MQLEGNTLCIVIFIFMHLLVTTLNSMVSFSFKMLSMEDISGRRTALAALRNCGYLVPLGYLAHQSMVINLELYSIFFVFLFNV